MLEMSDAEIVRRHNNAENPAAHIGILADLNCCSKSEIIAILKRNGAYKSKTETRGRKSTMKDRQIKAFYEQGFSYREIALRLGISPSTVKNWRKRCAG